METIKAWFPDRKILSGGIFGVVTFFLMTALNMWLGFEFTPEVMLEVSGGIGVLAAYFIPPSAADVIKRIDDTVKDLAGLTDK